jgi:hypothetical protein
MSETIFTTGFDVGGNDDKDAKMSIPTGTSGTHAVEKEEFIYRGDKDTGVLFILRYPDHPYFSPEAEDAFIKTIGALQLTLQDVAVVNLANEHNPNDWKKIMGFFRPKKITLLGVEPTSLKLPAIAHNSYMRGKIATVFNTFSFEEMFVDIDKKKLFWTEFKSFLQS